VKNSPGEHFMWPASDTGLKPTPLGGGRFFQRGDSGQPVEAWQSMLSYYGYAIEISGHFCELTEAVTVAFQRHFRPERVDGIADRSSIETLHRLISALPSMRAPQP
jgi:N-acetylmuramoyl-L-alanine amidase